MAFRHKWKPSKTAAREFAQTMSEIERYCIDNGISQSSRGDSYYFTIDGKDYRVSNHSVESSKKDYHPYGRENIICIHASKTRIREIFEDLKAGYELDGHGKRRNAYVNN